MRLDRLLAITLQLMAKKRVRASELAAQFEVSTRTIYREMELINQAGIPIVSIKGPNGGFELMDGFLLTKQHFTVQDFTTIYMLLQNIESAVGGKFTTLTHKVGSLHPKLSKDGYPDDILIDISTNPEEKVTVRTVYRAIEKKKIISFSYQSASNVRSERRIEPYRLYWERGTWYLEGYCLSRQSNRFFRISRMSRLQVLEESVQPKNPVRDLPENPSLGISAHLRFGPAAKQRVSEHFRGECRDCGSHIEVETVFYSIDYALSVLLSYGSNVVVLSPPELKDALLTTIRDIQTLYEAEYKVE
ncbi:MAG TPA: YafY family protein [Candidatus Bathyarchaeia archaeon]|nr:YafY family protein [Candidatus Bathyarchaeia archaeon]